MSSNGAARGNESDRSPSLLMRFYFYSFLVVAFAHEAYHLATGETFFWKIGEGTVRLTSMASDHSTTLGPVVLVGAVLLASACCSFLDSTGSRSRVSPKPSPVGCGAGQE
jgi:hypothetical protein